MMVRRAIYYCRQRALRRGDLHSLLALQSKHSIETLFKKIEIRNQGGKITMMRQNESKCVVKPMS